jgi:L-ascorbate metabolism protein UlaG (beta-lactamase superfamily)
MKLPGSIVRAQWASSSRPDEGGVQISPTWHLSPEFTRRSKIPYSEIMRAIRSGFKENRGEKESARVIKNIINGNEPAEELIDTDAVLSGGPLARPSLVFEDYSTWRLFVHWPGSSRPYKEYRVGPKQVRNGGWRSLLSTGEALRPPKEARYVDPSACGGTLTRREHASVELASPSGSRIIIDPIFRAPLLRCAATMPVPAPGIDAAFVTHSHGDHFNLATLDWLAAGGATIYVPDVPNHSLLAEDMVEELDACGLPGKVCETGSITQVGDMTVEALPFFGEQPSARVSPAEPGIRNWGNCYRVTTPGFSALVLADSGTDPSGSMLAAISESVKRSGPVDIVVGSLRDLYLPFDVEGLARYYIVLPVSGLRADYELYRRGKLPSATLGLSGTAAACAEAKAKIFLPYAHGLTGYGQPIVRNPFGPSSGADESTSCAALSEELRRIGSDTQIVSWCPGDSWAPMASAGARRMGQVPLR